MSDDMSEPASDDALPPRKKRTPLRLLLELVAAPIVLFEAWGWEPLQRLVGRLARFKLIAWLESVITALPPYAALATFAAPAIALFPVKIVSLFLMARGHLGLGICVLIGAKVAGTALVARLFLLTKTQLLRIRWFAAVYNRVVPWRDALLARVHATIVWRAAQALAAEVRQTVSRWFAKIRRSRRVAVLPRDQRSVPTYAVTLDFSALRRDKERLKYQGDAPPMTPSEIKTSVAAVITVGNQLRVETDADERAAARPAATASAIAALTEKFGARLPPSYLQFLAVHDGVRCFDYIDIDLFGAEELIENARELEAEWVDAGKFARGEIFVFGRSDSDSVAVAFVLGERADDGEMPVIFFDARVGYSTTPLRKRDLIAEHASFADYLRGTEARLSNMLSAERSGKT